MTSLHVALCLCMSMHAFIYYTCVHVHTYVVTVVLNFLSIALKVQEVFQDSGPVIGIDVDDNFIFLPNELFACNSTSGMFLCRYIILNTHNTIVIS